MKAKFEKLSPGSSSFLAFERRDLSFPFYWHYHPEYELTLILESHGQRMVGDSIEDYTSGDLVLLGPNLPHSWRSGPIDTGAEIHRAVVVQFREDFLGEGFFQRRELSEVACLLSQSVGGLSFGQTAGGRKVARYLAELPSLSAAQQLAAVFSALVELAAEKGRHTLSRPQVRPVCRVTDQHRVEAICRYLDNHYAEEIDFTRLSAKFRIDQTSLCRLFKRATGRTMTVYLNELRVAAAAQLLIETDESALDICFRVGFGNYSNFNRQFKRIRGFGPRSLRRQFFEDASSIANEVSRTRWKENSKICVN